MASTSWVAEGTATAENPLLRPSSIALGMLALSIGWGIRGNFGHEYGAMIAGALCGAAVALASGREDWRARVPFFAAFGALGWAIGGSMAYMPTIGYTHSGNLPTRFYGFFTAFTTGFLWSSLGGAGTAYAAVETRERLTALFRPLSWMLAAWAVDYFFRADFLRWYQAHFNAGEIGRDFRQRSAFYWLDSSWLEAWRTILVVCAFDLWDRRFEKGRHLAAYGAAGALGGWLAQTGLAAAGWLQPMLNFLVRPQGDLSAVNPATGRPFDPSDLVTNWPQVFTDLGPHMGWIIGLMVGAGLYFRRFGKFRSGSSLLLHMAVGGFTVFLAGPVLLSDFFGWMGGFRLVPPRGDNWAMVLGVLLGLLLYLRKNGLEAVTTATLITGVVGGLGLMCAQFLKILAFMPGNPVLTQNQSSIQFWAHWHHANWHSILAEQGVGLIYGLGVVLAMAAVSARIKPAAAPEPRTNRWTEVLCVAFVLNFIVYVNLVKNVAEWTRVREGGFQAMPLAMKAPLAGFIQLSALGWFDFFFLLFTVTTVVLLSAHLRRRVALVPGTWLGKGQLLFAVFAWIMVIGNFERALVGFHENRLATEGTIFVNALIACTVLLLCLRDRDSVPWTGEAFAPVRRNGLLAGFACLVVLAGLFTAILYGVYGNRRDGWGGNTRFGPDADWRVRPVMKSVQHR